MSTNQKGIRVYSLDTLRGLAIFGMILSGELPWKGLPTWMYHGQVPPPDHIFNPNLPGITWVDLVFPFFMFAMGAAIPFALTRRIEKSEPYWKLVSHIIWRGIILFAFGIFLGNTQPWEISHHPDFRIRIQCLIGFIGWVLAFARLPWEFANKTINRKILQIIGILAIIVVLATIRKEDGTGFDKSKNDIIIMLLAFGYTASSLLWLVSRNSLMTRLALIAGVCAFWLGGGPIIQTLDKWLSPVNWLFGSGWIQLAVVILSGSIIGDILLNWVKQEKSGNQELGLKTSYLGILIISLPAIVIGGLIFLKTQYIFSGLLYTVALCQMIYCILRSSQTEPGKLLKQLFQWGFFFLVIGYLIEPFQGGIKKDPATFSYYFTSAGMGICLLIFFYLIIDILKKGWSVGFLTVVGGNPMLAYIAGSYLVYPVLYLTSIIKPIDSFIGGNLPLGTIWAFISTFLVCYSVYLFTRIKIYLRV